MSRFSDKEAKWDGVPFPCGQCLACRINKRRVWTLRLSLERRMHDKAAFVTLTYDPQHIPMDMDLVPQLCKRDCQLFVKRLRKRYGDGIRYYLCGEYGETYGRPHYHAIIFGVGPEDLDPYWLMYRGKSPESPLKTLWGKGLVHVGDCTLESVQYVAGYVTKKISKMSEDSLEPEFALMSRRPGIGAGMVSAIADTVKAAGLEDKAGAELRMDGRKWPLGRYLLGKLADAGVKTQHDPDAYIKDVWQSYVESQRQGSIFIDHIVKRSQGARTRLEQRENRKRVRDFNHA